MKFFSKEPPVEEKDETDPTEITPEGANDYYNRGYAYYARGNFEKAEADFQKALQMGANPAEIYYAMGLAVKNDGRMGEAVEQFEKALEHLQEGAVEDDTRARMLIRLARGHINHIEKGDWDIYSEAEEEVQS